MSPPDELTYTTAEIRSFLPTGWSLPTPEAEGHWDRERGTWSLTLIDGADLERPVEIDLSKAEALGRMEALRLATRQAYLRVLL
jgi:hypothetical protein